MEHLIPQSTFDGLPGLALLAITGVCFAVLIKGAGWLVEGASGLAYRLGMPKVIVGATIVSLGTTSPEAAISVMAAWNGNPGLALGNAVGSIIADTGLIFGVGCMMVALPADRFVLDRQGWVQFASGILLAGLCFAVLVIPGVAPELSREVGFLLLVALAGYLWISVLWARVHPQGEPFVVPEDLDEELDGVILPHEHKPRRLAMLIGMVVVGFGLVIVSSQVVVSSVSALASQWGVPDLVIASTIVAFGTSLPELVVGITSIRKGHAELLVGNVIGADILNVLFVVGASAAASGLPIDNSLFLYLHLPTMLIILTMFRVFIFSAVKNGTFQRWHGVPLLVIYCLFVVLQYVLA